MMAVSINTDEDDVEAMSCRVIKWEENGCPEKARVPRSDHAGGKADVFGKSREKRSVGDVHDSCS